MDIRNSFPSKYLRAAQVAGCPNGTVRVQIKRLAIEKMRARGGASEEKPVLYFERAKKGLVLNRTNAEVIAAAYGWETDAWRGHVVELFVAEVEAFGEVVDAVRVRIPKAAPAPKAPETPSAPPPATIDGPADLFPDSDDNEPHRGDLDADGNPF